MSDIKPAIVLVGYNRVECISRLLHSVNEAYYPEEDIKLIVSLDKSDKTDDIIKAVKRIGFLHGSMEIKTYPERLGLKEHILKCGDLTQEYGAVIILEDDLVVAKSFYEYTCQALNFYGDEECIAGISLYSHAWNGYSNYQFIPKRNQYDTYLGQFSITWGQCWTRLQWIDFKEWYKSHEAFKVPNYDVPEQIEYFGEQSWGRYYACYVVDCNKFYVIPYTSMSTNYSEVGEHGATINTAHQVMLFEAEANNLFRLAPVDKAIKYDMFFERVLNGIMISGINAEDICFDLNLQHRKIFGKKYLLSTMKYKDLEVVDTFGLMLRPIEENVLKRVKGNEIFLYKIPSDGYQLSNDIEDKGRLRYELYNHWSVRLYKFSKAELSDIYISKVRNKITKVHKKIALLYSAKANSIVEKRNKRKKHFENGHVLMFHDISDLSGEFTVSLLRFKTIIEEHLKNGYTFISLDELISSKDVHKKCVITFDDGYKSVLDCIPYMNANNIPFCVYVVSSKIGEEEYLSEEDLKEMSKNSLCTIGNHTSTHVMARFTKKEELRNEVTKANETLSMIVQKPIEHFAFPYGSFYAVSKSNIRTVLKLKTFKSVALTTQADVSGFSHVPAVINRFDAARPDVLEVL